MEKSSEIRSAVYCFLTLAKYLGVAVNETDLSGVIEASHTDEGEILLLKFATKYRLKSRLVVWKNKKKLEKMAGVLPVIAKDRENHFFILAKLQENKAVIISDEMHRPQSITIEEFMEQWSGTIVLVAKKGGETAETFFSFKWFIPTILKFKREFLLVVLAAFVVQLLGVLTPIMTQVVVDKVLSHHTLSTLNVLAVGIAIVYLYDLILSLARGYLFTHTTNRIDVMLSQRLFHHLFDLPLRYFESRRAGETIARVRELDTIRQFLTGTPLSSLIDLFFIIVYIVVLFLYSTSLTWLVIASVPVYALLSLIVTPLFKKRLDEKFNAGAETSSFLVESIQGVQTVKAFALENKFEEKWGDLQADYVKAGYRTSMVSHTSGTIAQFVQKIFDLLILYFGALEVMNGAFSVGQLVAFRMLSGRISGPVLRLVQLWQEYQQASLSVRRIGDIFNSSTEVKSSIQITNLPALQGKIRFDRVHFRYKADGPEAIKDMSFLIEPGSIIGVVGRSGSGKSTISKLIQRLYIPEMGKITIDGMDISMIEPRQLRRQIGVVLQENFMFNGSVRDNIAIHMKSASFEQIMGATQIAGAHDFIMELTNGYDTMIGEKGVGLSGGQKQRIAIARAILANPGILIFDEATSALDYESESIIQNNLKKICKGRTVLIIAHRLSTLKDADKIMVIDSGNLTEYDTYENLLQKKGIYYHLYRRQLRGNIDGQA